MADPSTPRASSARTGAVIFTGLAVVLAASGGWLMWRMLAVGGYDREPLRPVVVAEKAIGAGHPLKAEDVKIKMWPASSVPAGAFTEVAPLLKPSPAVPTAGFVEGEPILKDRLASPEAGPGLSALVGKESRAITVQVDRATAVSKLLYPGARVDVLVTLEDRLHGVVVTRTVLEDTRVLAIGTFADVDAARRGAEPGKASSDADAVVTLEVSPQEAEKLALSARQGKLDLTLRNATDRSHTPTVGVAVADLVQTGQGEPADGAATKPVEPAAQASSRRRSSSSNGSSAPPAVRSFPRLPGNDQKPAGSTIEVYSVPTQSR